MTPLMFAVRGEAVRLAQSRLPRWSLLTAVACGGLLTGLISLIGPENSTPPMPGLHTSPGVGTVLGLLSITLFAPALIGTAAISSEYRHRTMATTFLAVPRRGRVLAAKLIVFGALGLAYGLVMALTAVGGVYAGTVVHGIAPGVGFTVMLGTTLRYGLAAAIYMLLGVGIGAIARHQLLAIGITLGYFYLLENLLMAVPGANVIYAFLPGGATSALTGSTALQEIISAQTGAGGAIAQTPLVGAVVLLGYAVAAAVVATVASLRRDIA